MNKEYLVKYYMGLGRSADLEGVVILNEENYNKILQLKEERPTISLGELAGKHSEVLIAGEEWDDIKLVSDDPAKIAIFRDLLGEGIDGAGFIDRILEQA